LLYAEFNVLYNIIQLNKLYCIKKVIHYIIVWLIILVNSPNATGRYYPGNLKEDDNDSVTYFSDYSELLALRIYTNTKWNSLEIIKDDQNLKLQPNGPTALGIGFNYKGYGLALAVGLPKSASSNEKYGETKRFDLQVNMFGKKIGFDGYVQMYKGYYNSNPQDFIVWENENYPQLPEMKIVSFGINAFYIFNSEKFSYRAAFIRNQIQKKSAGSFTAGIFGHMDIAQTDNGFIPKEFPDSIRTNFDLKSFNTISIGITVGYLYTWVISEHFFINIGVVPGFGLQTINLETTDGVETTTNEAAGQLTARGAIGYDSKYFYAGVTAATIWRNFQYKGYDLDLSTEQLKIFIGKRFDLSKKSK